MYADENVIKIKHAVLREVAKLAFEGTLDAQRDHIAVRLIPGPTPQFRCCIYKEREIIRQRVRLAEGKAPGPEDNGNVIQVISAPVRTARFPVIPLQKTVRTVWERHVSMHVNSVPLRRDVIVPTLIRRNVKSVDDVQLHVLTMQSRI